MVFPAPILTFDFGGETGVGRVDKRAGFAFNAYCGQRDPAIGALLPYLAAKPCSFSANLSFTHALDESRRNGDALFMTELGATDDLSGFADYLNGANALSLSWTYWAYWNTDPSASRPMEGLIRDIGQPPVGANVKTDKLMALAQPYARVTAGTPRRWAFDPATRSFDFVYGTSPARKTDRRFKPGSVTALSIPTIQYPTGYRVRVRGAEVLSRPNARTLRLARCGRAKKVRVQVGSGGKTGAAARSCGRKHT
jgi:endoglycosylceramidase